MSLRSWRTAVPPIVRGVVRGLILWGIALILLDILWGAIADPLLENLATQLGGYGDPVVTAAFLITHVVVEIGTPLGTAFIGAAITTALVSKIVDADREKRVL